MAILLSEGEQFAKSRFRSVRPESVTQSAPNTARGSRPLRRMPRVAKPHHAASMTCSLSGGSTGSGAGARIDGRRGWHGPCCACRAALTGSRNPPGLRHPHPGRAGWPGPTGIAFGLKRARPVPSAANGRLQRRRRPAPVLQPLERKGDRDAPGPPESWPTTAARRDGSHSRPHCRSAGGRAGKRARRVRRTPARAGRDRGRRASICLCCNSKAMPVAHVDHLIAIQHDHGGQGTAALGMKACSLHPRRADQRPERVLLLG